MDFYKAYTEQKTAMLEMWKLQLYYLFTYVTGKQI